MSITPCRRAIRNAKSSPLSAIPIQPQLPLPDNAFDPIAPLPIEVRFHPWTNGYAWNPSLTVLTLHQGKQVRPGRWLGPVPRPLCPGTTPCRRHCLLGTTTEEGLPLTPRNDSSTFSINVRGDGYNTDPYDDIEGLKGSTGFWLFFDTAASYTAMMILTLQGLSFEGKSVTIPDVILRKSVPLANGQLPMKLT